MKTQLIRATPAIAAAAAVAALAACGPSSTEVVRSETVVLRKIALNKVDDGVASGLDLDGFTSDTHDGRTCFKPDFVDAAGNKGIDNQLATLIPLVDLAGEGALEGLLQNAINEGRLLVIFDYEERGDGQTKILIRRGDDIPLLGTDGFLLGGQTLGLHAEPELGMAASGSIQGSMVTTEPFALEMPVIVFSILYLITLPDARLKFEIDADGNFTKGVIAGSASVEQLLGIVKQAAEFGGDFETLLNSALNEAADLDRDGMGKCRSLSAAIDFDAIPAFVF